MKKKYRIIVYMPYRALTHNRVQSFLTATNATTQTQATAINSQSGVANSGPVATQRNKNNSSNKQPSSRWRRVNCTKGTCPFLMAKNAYGEGAWVCGDGYTGKYCKKLGTGKGYPNATPQTSVGSTNTFARRAIARRAVTSLTNTGKESQASADCACLPTQIRNLKGELINSN
jgi:hypothetical protein